MQHNTNNPPEPVTLDIEPDQLSILDYLLVIAKYKKRIIVNTMIAAALAVVFSLFMTKIYTAKTMILPSDDEKGMMGAGAMLAQMGGLAGIAGGALGGATKVDLYVTMLRSDTLKDSLIDRFKLMDLYELKYRSLAYKKLDGISKVTAGKKDGVITITVDNKDPKLAAELANAYVDELGKLVVNLGITGAGNNRVFLEKRLAEAKADLAKAEDNLKDFQLKNKAISVTDQARVSIEGVAQLRARLAIKEVELGTLQRQFTDSSQEMKIARSTIANLKTQIAALEGKGPTSSIPSVGSMPQVAQEYLRLMREFKVQEAIFEMLTKQFEISQLNESKDVAPIQILQKAKVPDRKSKPSRAKFVIVCTFMVFMSSVAYVLAKESFLQMTEHEQNRIKTLMAEVVFSRNK